MNLQIRDFFSSKMCELRVLYYLTKRAELVVKVYFLLNILLLSCESQQSHCRNSIAADKGGVSRGRRKVLHKPIQMHTGILIRVDVTRVALADYDGTGSARRAII